MQKFIENIEVGASVLNEACPCLQHAQHIDFARLELFFEALKISALRIAKALLWVLAVGVPVGVLLGSFPAFDAFFRLPVDAFKAVPIVLKPSQIVERNKLPTSIMPKGLFDKLTIEELVDLLAYVAARGDQKSQVFSGGHHH